MAPTKYTFSRSHDNHQYLLLPDNDAAIVSPREVGAFFALGFFVVLTDAGNDNSDGLGVRRGDCGVEL